jgi:sterol 24-C-methyltransferase
MMTNPRSKLYRLSTMLRSLKAIYQLPPEKVEAFIQAYDIYDCDWVEGQAVKDSQKVDYTQVKQNLLNWYEVINHLCAIGVVEKMYIPPTIDPSQSVINNQILFERQFAEWLGMKAGDKVFELGCGKGRVAAHLASTTGASITGINIDQGQLDNATEHARKNGLSNQCKFMNADFNDLPFPFPDNYFDCIYEVQVLSLSRDLEKLFKELNRLLKPGGKISLAEWVRLPNYDEANPHHVDLLKRIKPLVGAIGTPSPAEYETALQKAGFDVLISVDPSVNKSQELLIDKAGGYFDKILPFINFLVKIRILPKHFIALFDRLGKNTAALCEADRLGLVTMSYQIIAQKR